LFAPPLSPLPKLLNNPPLVPGRIGFVEVSRDAGTEETVLAGLREEEEGVEFEEAGRRGEGEAVGDELKVPGKRNPPGFADLLRSGAIQCQEWSRGKKERREEVGG